MKIAITAAEPTLDANTDPRFGRCQYFIFVDPETLDFEAIANHNRSASGGVGTIVAQMICGREISAVITGNCGPNAHQVLSAAGIDVVTGVVGKVQDAIRSYQAGEIQASSQPSVKAHFGMGRGRHLGRGRGMGRA